MTENHDAVIHDADDRVRVGVGIAVHRCQHSQPRARYTQRGAAQHSLAVGSTRHPPE